MYTAQNIEIQILYFPLFVINYRWQTASFVIILSSNYLLIIEENSYIMRFILHVYIYVVHLIFAFNVPRTRISLPVMLLTGSICHRRSQNDVWYINWPKSETWNNRRINHLMEVIWSILRSGKCLRGVLCLTSQEPGVVTYFLLHWCRLYPLVTHFLAGVSPDFSVVMDASVRAL
jgi:hypothetical protein